MGVYSRGSLSFTRRSLGNWEPGPTRAIEIYDCYRPPRGTVHPLRLSLDIELSYVAGHIQPHEEKGLLGAGRRPRERAFDLDELLSDLAAGLGFEQSDQIDPDNIPADWKRVVECYRVTIGCRIVYRRWTITAQASADVDVDGVGYPKGDTVATFEVAEPFFHFFERRFEFAPRCCPRAPLRHRSPDFSDYFGVGAEEYKRWRKRPRRSIMGGPGEDKIREPGGDDTIFGGGERDK